MKFNVKFSLVLSYAPRHLDVWWSEGIAPHSLNLNTRRK